MYEEYKVILSDDERFSAPEGPCIREAWFKDGVHHRIGAPAVTVRYPRTGAVAYEEFYQYGQDHRLDGPAVIVRDIESGVVVRERWCQDGLLHREDGPAYTRRDPVTGAVLIEQNWFKGTAERDYNYLGPSTDEPGPGAP